MHHGKLKPCDPGRSRRRRPLPPRPIRQPRGQEARYAQSRDGNPRDARRGRGYGGGADRHRQGDIRRRGRGALPPRPHLPAPRGRAITLALPDGARAGDTVAAFNATLQAMAAGEITPDEAVTVTRMLDGRLEALNAFKLERELTRYRGDFIRGDELFRPEAERFRESGEIAGEVGEDEMVGEESEEAAVDAAAQTEAATQTEEPSPRERAG